MADEYEDFYKDLGEVDQESNKNSEEQHSLEPDFILIKLKDADALSRIINGQAVSLPMSQSSKISYIFDKNKDTHVFFLTKIGDPSINSDDHM